MAKIASKQVASGGFGDAWVPNAVLIAASSYCFYPVKVKIGAELI